MTWAPDYCTAAQYKAYARIGDTVDDTEIATSITASSRAIDRACARQFGKVAAPEARSYVARFDRHRPRPAWCVDIDDIATTTGLVVTIGGVAVTDYSLEPLNAVAKGKVWTLLVFGPNAEAVPDASQGLKVDATGSWGWSSTPTTVIAATKLQTARFMARRDSPYGVAGSPADGSELRLLAAIDPDVRVMLSEYVRRWAAASGSMPTATVPPRYPWGAW